jgi:predicted metal-dependent HD superfamily phosphohydrolase
MIRHIVTWKLKAQDAEGKSAGFTAMAEALGALPQTVSEIRHLTIGQDLGTIDGNWDVTLIIDFETQADLAAYQVHPDHVEAAKVVRENVTERATVDFEI